MSAGKKTWRVSGMYCPRCENKVARAANALPGIRGAQADFRSGTLTAEWDASQLPEKALAAAIAEAGYTLVRQSAGQWKKTALQGILLLAAMAALFFLLAYTPLQAWLGAFPVAREGMGLGALFLVGVTTSLHCMAMCGGINLAQSAASAQKGRRVVRSNVLYNLGRVISYTVTGAIVGALGAVLRISTGVQAAIQVIAAVLMLAMAVSMLDIPALRALTPRLPAGLRTRLLQRGGTSSLWIGLANGLMPCGPLQTMQLFALTAGSWWRGALAMLCFSLGTVPLMLGFGLVSGGLNRRFAKPLRIASGALVLVMAMAMLTNGLALAGVRMGAPAAQTVQAAVTEEDVQHITSELEWRGYPAITVQKGVPVRWVIHAEERKLTGCNNEIVIPALNLRVPLQPGDNVIEFTADQAGEIPYTCWMGMIHSTITVVD